MSYILYHFIFPAAGVWDIFYFLHLGCCFSPPPTPPPKKKAKGVMVFLDLLDSKELPLKQPTGRPG